MAYRVQYTFTRVHARISNGHPRARKSARVGQVGGQVGEDRRACTARCKLNGEAGHADILATILARSRRGCPCPCRSHGIPALWHVSYRSGEASIP